MAGFFSQKNWIDTLNFLETSNKRMSVKPGPVDKEDVCIKWYKNDYQSHASISPDPPPPSSCILACIIIREVFK